MKAVVAVLEVRESGASGKVVDFTAWMAAEQRRIYLLCLRLLRDTHEADSATQDVFVKASRALQSSNGQAIDDRAHWLTRVAVNTCMDRLRSKRWLFWQRRASEEDAEATRSARSAHA